jgi:hypothetical protein
MGQVYRADDLHLGHPVALKFLPSDAQSNEPRLKQFRDEVRLSRQIAHPNVCRVYDIAETEGLSFLSMEYVNGEDLRALLTRIGRLPKDKAEQVAGQMCAGLAAAHQQGVLHGDLKPANVMLDSKGQVRITDFGLARLVSHEGSVGALGGTPDYMAPETALRRQISVQSDLYALGLIMYEMFTGRPAFPKDERPQGPPPPPSFIVEDIEPAVEAAILRCLAIDPGDRPESAVSLGSAFPGGDVLATAIALGETPSPEMVAAAGLGSAMTRRMAWWCFGLLLAGLFGVVALSGRSHFINRIEMSLSPPVLEARGRAVLERLGQVDPGVDAAQGFYVDRHALDWAQDRLKAGAATGRSDVTQPPPLTYWYRRRVGTSLKSMTLYSSEGRWGRVTFGRPTWNEPAFVDPGELGIRLTPAGTMFEYRAVPSAAWSTNRTAAEPPWNLWFPESDTGFDLAALSPAALRRPLPVACDAQQSWEGHWPGTNEKFVVQAGAYGGRPVYFSVADESSGGTPSGKASTSPIALVQFSRYVFAALFLLLILGAGFLALRNHRMQRGDRRGSFRLAVYMFSTEMLLWFLEAHHTNRPEQVGIFYLGFSAAMAGAGLTYLAYMALEPYVRRLWPSTLVTWNRLLGGRWKDPLIGRDVLIACLMGTGLVLVRQLNSLVPAWLGLGNSPLIQELNLESIQGLRGFLSHLLREQADTIHEYLLLLYVMMLLRALVRKVWLSTALSCAACWVMLAALGRLDAGHPETLGISIALGIASILWLMSRFGLLSVIVAVMVTHLLRLPVTSDFSAWYAGYGLFAVFLVFLAAAYGLYTSTQGRPLSLERLLDFK